MQLLAGAGLGDSLLAGAGLGDSLLAGAGLEHYHSVQLLTRSRSRKLTVHLLARARLGHYYSV